MKSSSPAFFVIPGFKQQATDKNYKWLIVYLKKEGFKVLPVPIEWKYRVMSDYINDFKKFYTRHKNDVNYVLGFSFGAAIAFSSANELGPKKIFLCSLSPAFREDTRSMKPWIKKLVGKKRLRDSSSRSAKEIARNLKVPATVFYGEKEGQKYPELKKRCEEAAKLVKKAKLVIVPNSPHKIEYPEYRRAIQAEIDPIE